ncbi:FG-GAP-like repeat-containing protein [Streptomyces flavochromogenes]|uniref:FG-GAP-like repeat-containing protein n=1 Tax=Streptomyces flavochromogenes TaxID=68199 RepID=UPI00068E4E8C|nr:FG-GAP-like repeat-containing protein [Streptomyces flavochromogenes]
MLTSVLAVAPAASVTPAGAPSAATSVASDDPVANGSLSEEDYALQQAAATGRPQEVVSRRTESSETWAQPEGSFKVTEHGTPVWLWRDGGWVAADPTLMFATDGSVVTKATNVAVKFSGGGTAPLLQGSKDGRSLSLTWPNALPTPTLDGNIATYAEVFPGVDLQLKAEVEGFSQVFVVKTAEAAQNPQLDQLRFGIDTDGLTVGKDAESGSLTALDPAGQIVFSSSAPMMWDSTTTATSQPAAATTLRSTMALTAEAGEATPAAEGEDTFDPGLGAQDAVMPTQLTSDTLTITPDQQLLDGAETTYPVYIDPSWGYGDRQKWNWTRVYKAWPSNSYWNAKDPVRVGYEAQSGGSNRISRSFFQLDISHLKKTQVKSATFRVKNTWSWSCNARDLYLYPTGAINSKTNWTNQPDKLTSSPLDTVRDAKGWVPADGSSSSCPAGNLEFDATSWVKSKAAAGADDVTFGLYADEDDTFGWKKFDPKTVVLETVYNTAPDLPTKLGTSPVTPCASGGNLGNVTVSLYATITDEDKGNLTATFELYENKSGTSTRVFTKAVPALNGRVATLAVPVSMTPGGTGVSYTWRVQTTDSDNAPSGWKSAPCAFKVDRQRPKSPPEIISPSVNGKPVYPPGNDGWPNPTGLARKKAVFTFKPAPADAVTKIFWWTDTHPDVRTSTPVNGVFTGEVTIPAAGPRLIYAYGVDAAGNRSDTGTYLYYANRELARDEPNDLNGDRFKDIWSPDSSGTLIAYTGNGNREFSAVNATSGDAVFPDRQVSVVGDWQQDGYNDLLALVPNPNDNNRKQLQVYKNYGSGLIDTQEGPHTLRVSRDSNNHWFDADQIVGGSFDDDGAPDVLVKQGSALYFYRGTRSVDVLSAPRGVPVRVGDIGMDWSKYTVVSAGDLNGDKLPDLLLRDDATGDLFRSHGAKDPALNKINFATWGNDRVKIGSGLKKSLYPQIGTSGDLDGDGTGDGVLDGDKITDLWARKADNTMIGWRGKGSPTSLTGFDVPFTIDGVTGGVRLVPGTVINPGSSLASQSSTLTLGTDGNLFITTKAGKKVWSSTGGTAGAVARVEDNGNLSVYNADNKRLWTTGAANAGEGFTMLRDSGDLTVYNDKTQSLWSSGTAVRHDYNRDGRSDMANWYDYGDGHDEIHAFTTNSDGTFKAPQHAWSAAAGNYWAENMKHTTGDFNGDGVGDIAAFYGYEDGRMNLRTWLGKGDGNFNAPFVSWQVPAGHWNFDAIHVQSGDFNGDGRDDIATWYAYGDGSDKLFTFTADVRGGFNYPFSSFYRADGWYAPNMKFTSGDYNADGRDDIGVFYGYDNGDTTLFTFTAKPTGAFNEPLAGWTSTDWGSFEATSVHSGDFNGDGRDDIVTWYDYGDGHDAMISFTPSGTGGAFGGRKEIWTIPAGNFWRENIKIVTGDFNGDGRDDIGGMYGYEDGRVRTLTWTAKTDGTLNYHVGGWETPPGNWSFGGVRMIERYSPA